MPEFADLAALPAPNQGGGAMVGPGVGQALFDGPAADLSAVDFEVALAEYLAGGKTVRGGRFAAETLAQERLHFGGPIGCMVAPRNAGLPGGFLTVRTGFEVIAIELVEATTAQAELVRGDLGVDLASTETGQHVTD